MRYPILALLLSLLEACASVAGAKMDAGGSPLLSLSEIDPSIGVEMRYFTDHNFLGRRVRGYRAPKCLLTREAATALAAVQAELRLKRLSLKVYDCYRPQRAVNDFVTWSHDASDEKMKREFYPQVDKRQTFQLGYIASRSGHSRGSTVDLTLTPFPAPPSAPYHEGDALVECTAESSRRFADNTVDMGTGYDCFDPKAHTDSSTIGTAARQNRQLLKSVMEKHGFKNYESEWWHYTLRAEPYPETYFDHEIQ